jgi:hypothetical protein
MEKSPANKVGIPDLDSGRHCRLLAAINIRGLIMSSLRSIQNFIANKLWYSSDKYTKGARPKMRKSSLNIKMQARGHNMPILLAGNSKNKVADFRENSGFSK